MKREEFIEKLMQHLTSLPLQEKENVKAFYEEMLDDAGVEQGEEVPLMFQDPEEIAKNILQAEEISFESKEESKETVPGGSGKQEQRQVTQDIEKMVLDVEGISLKIYPTAEKQIYIQDAEFSSKELSTHVEGNTFYLNARFPEHKRENIDFSLWGISFGSRGLQRHRPHRLKIFLPLHLLPKLCLELQATSSSVKLEDLSLLKIAADVKASALKLEHVQTEQLQLHLQASSCKVEGSFEDCTLHADASSCKLKTRKKPEDFEVYTRLNMSSFKFFDRNYAVLAMREGTEKANLKIFANVSSVKIEEL